MQPIYKITYVCLKEFGENVDTTRAAWRLGEDTLSFVPLHALHNAKTATEVAALQTKVKAVAAGQILATVEAIEAIEAIEAMVQGDAGSDVLDQPAALPPKEILKAGDHVVTTQQGIQFEASIYGYVSVLQNCISVVPPIWISPDRMEAYYVSLPQIGTAIYPAKADVEALLERLKIKVGIQSDTIEALCRKLAGGEKVPVLTLVAQGQPPQPGENARLAYSFDIEEKPGKVLKDGSIDLRERNLLHSVSADTLLAEKIEPTQGVTGQTLFAEPIETTAGEDISVEAGTGVRLSDEGGIKLYAETDGVARLQDGKLCVTPVFVLQGDVDYKSGNIDLDTDVQISGWVRSGFTVKASGSVTVGDGVEDGAIVNVQGDVTIGKGVIGANTRIIVQGDFRAQFIQNASVIAKGNIWVGSYIMNATVRAGG
jgi:uncharacterized protein (DUF342 family)